MVSAYLLKFILDRNRTVDIQSKDKKTFLDVGQVTN